jgi:hypothetical protein
MRTVLFASVASSLMLGGCMTNRMTPTETIGLIQAFHQAGCGGSLDIDIQGGAGQLGGQGSASFRAKGECPVGDLPPPPEPLF